MILTTAEQHHNGPLLGLDFNCQLVLHLEMVERDFSPDFLLLFMFYTLSFAYLSFFLLYQFTFE